MQFLSVSIVLAGLLALPTFANSIAPDRQSVAIPEIPIAPGEFGLWRPFDRARPRGRIGKRGNDMIPEDARQHLAKSKVIEKDAAVHDEDLDYWRSFDQRESRHHDQKRGEQQSADVSDLIKFKGHKLDSTPISLGAHKPKSAPHTPANYNEEELDETD